MVFILPSHNKIRDTHHNQIQRSCTEVQKFWSKFPDKWWYNMYRTDDGKRVLLGFWF
jgi:hypothetical protein